MLRYLTTKVLCVFLLAATPLSAFAQQRQAAQEPVFSVAQPSPDQQAILAGVGNVQVSANFSPGAVFTREQSIITFNNIAYSTLPGK